MFQVAAKGATQEQSAKYHNRVEPGISGTARSKIKLAGLAINNLQRHIIHRPHPSSANAGKRGNVAEMCPVKANQEIRQR